MFSRQQIRELIQRVSNRKSPVLSLYVSVNSAREGNGFKATLLRVKDTLKRIDAPAELSEHVENRLRLGEVRAARTLALFGDQNDLEAVALQVDLPVIDAVSGELDARWGEPFLTPLTLALDEYERYGVVYVDSKRLRLFEVFLGEIDEIADAFRPWAPGQDDRLSHSKRTHPAYVASRDHSGRERVARRMDEWTYRFYKQSAQELDAAVRERGLDRLILMGPEEDVWHFESALPKPLRERIVAHEPSLSSPGASASEVLERVSGVIRDVESRKEGELLDAIRERGTWGIEQCLEDLQQGRVQVVAVPVDLEGQVWFVPELGYATTEESKARGQANGYELRREPLRALLPELAESYGARVEFVTGANAKRVHSEHGGLAGLLRW